MRRLDRDPPIEHKISYTIRIILIKSVANKFIDQCISITNYLVPANQITKSCPIAPGLVDFSIGIFLFLTCPRGKC